MPALPDGLFIGRTTLPGPVSGGYLQASFGPFAVASNDARNIGFIVPFDLRIQRVQWSITGASAGQTTLAFWKHPSAFQVAGGTQLQGTAAATPADIDLDANVTGFADGSTGASGAVGTLITLARNCVRGDRVFFRVVADGTGSAVDMTVGIVFTVTGHAQTDTAND